MKEKSLGRVKRETGTGQSEVRVRVANYEMLAIAINKRTRTRGRGNAKDIPTHLNLIISFPRALNYAKYKIGCFR